MYKVTSSKKFVELPSLYGSSEKVVLPEILKIPKLSQQELADLYKKLKPIATVDGIKYLLKEYTTRELSDTSYTWDLPGSIRTIVDPYKLDPIEDFYCLHTWGYYGFFKPSIAEILSQTTDNIREYANTFEIIESPDTRDDVFKYKRVIDGGYHLSRVRAYKLNK